MAEFRVSGYLVSIGAFNTLTLFPGATAELFEPVGVVIEDDDGLVGLDELSATSVTIGDDDQGPITAISFRKLVLDEGEETRTFSFAVLERDAVADVILLPVDPVSGQVLPADLPQRGGYTAGETFPLTSVDVTSAPPLAPAPDAATVAADDDATVVDVLANDSGGAGDLSVTAVGETDNGGAALLDDGTVSFDPDGDFTALADGANATTRFSYTVSDGDGSAEATVTVTVTGVNDAPLPGDDTALTDQDTPITIAVLDDDFDVDDGDTLSLASVGTPDAGGTALLDAGSVVFDPAGDFDDLGTDQSRTTAFAYEVTDGTATASATVTVTVEGSNDAPEPGDDEATTTADATVTIDVLADDTDVDGDQLVLEAAGTPDAGGQARIENGAVVFDPSGDFDDLAAGEVRTTSFGYDVGDGTETASATVTVTVEGVEREAPYVPPELVDDEVATDAGQTVVVDVLANDETFAGSIAVTAVGEPDGGGSVEIVEGGIAFQAGDDFVGLGEGETATTTFTYDASDGTTESTASVTVTVTGVNEAPAPTGDTAETDEDTPFPVAVLANDGDADLTDTLALVSVDAPDSGGTTRIEGEEIVFDPAGDFETLGAGESAQTAFTYAVTDGTETRSATAVVTVTGVNDAPSPDKDEAETVGTAPVVVDVLANDTDPEDDALTVAAAGPPENGSVEIVDGTIRYTANAGFAGEDTFEYTVSDGTGEATAAVTVSVEPSTGPGDDVVTARPGPQTLSLGGGSDSVIGALVDLLGDTIGDFDDDDQIVVTDEEIERGNIDVSRGSAILSIDADGDGEPEGTITLTGDFTGGDFMAVGDDGETIITFEDFLPVLAERSAVDPALVNGIVNEIFLRGDGETDFTVTLRDLGFAGYDNVVGVYEIDEGGEIVDERILFANANADKAASATVTDVEDGHRLGFFIVQDAAEWYASLDEGATLEFVSADGGPARVDGGPLRLAVDGVLTDETAFHSYSADLNPDGLEHVLSGVDPGGESITIGFEDLTNGGDRDYEDVVFSVGLA